MKLIYIYLFYTISCIVINFNVAEGDKIVTIQKDKSYPKKSLANLKTETFYIPLETNKDVLLDIGAHVYFVSDTKLLITNWKRGDVYIFDWNGRIVSRFNQKGGNGYLFINYAVYDEPKKEIYILDKIGKKIFVYTETGVLKRTLKHPANLNLTKIYNFDGESLLVYHEHMYEKMTQRQPYMIISKANGQILSKLDFFIDKVNPTTITTDKGFFSVKTSSGNCKFGNEYFLANICSDTICFLSQDKSLSKIFVQSPSVFADSHLITTIALKTDDFIILNIYPYDLMRSYKDNINGKQALPYVKDKNILFNLKNQQIYECMDFHNATIDVDIPQNMSVELLSAYRLKQRLEKGDLEGKLKEIAKEVDVTDNPVIKITKFK